MSWEVLPAAARSLAGRVVVVTRCGGEELRQLEIPFEAAKGSLTSINPNYPTRNPEQGNREGEKSLFLPPPPLQEPLDYMFHISPHQRRDVIFPALFSSRLSTQFVEKHERLQRSPRSRAGAGKPGRALAAHLAGAGAGAPADKSRNLRTGLSLSLLFSRDRKRSSRRGGSRY